MARSQELSWGRLTHFEQSCLKVATPQTFKDDFDQLQGSYLASGQHRSYGDVGLNQNGNLVLTHDWSGVLAADWSKGQITLAAGMTLGAVLNISLARGWILPVLPGTQFVSIGGAIANDIHGKNHHLRGSFGDHVLEFELFRSNGQLLKCSPSQNSELFYASIGGLGLTGIIFSATIQLVAVKSPYIYVEKQRTRDLDDFFRLTEESDAHFEYSVSWLDLSAPSKKMGRGIFIRGNPSDGTRTWVASLKPRLSIPFNAPSFVLSKASMQIFNAFYYRHVSRRGWKGEEHPFPFFFPLDSVRHWNRLYGRRGFYQYQFVIPSNATIALSRILAMIKSSGKTSFLSVLKKFGNIGRPQSLLSFPREGYTLALDFASSPGLETLFKKLDEEVASAGGRLYFAKDARMPKELVKQFYPELDRFLTLVDPRCQSSLKDRLF